MRKHQWWTVFSGILLLMQCKPAPTKQDGLTPLVAGVECMAGRQQYLASPFVTAGDRVYMVGHQNGQFPDLGWHITGEMGGIWDHPIKLMDGFTASISLTGQSFCLAQADTFLNYPFANQHIYRLKPAGLRVERFQFVPDGQEGLVVEYRLINEGAQAKRLTFEFTGFTDLRPTWLGERTGMRDAGDYTTWDEASASWIGKDSLNDWYVVFGSSVRPASHGQPAGSCDFQPKGRGSHASLRYEIDIPPASSFLLPFTIAGSNRSAQRASQTFADVQSRAARYLKEKKERYAAIGRKTRLTIPDKELEQAFRWVKYNTDWLMREVPGTGRGLSAGLPDYPWWFGVDNAYALQGLIAIGQTDNVYRTIALLHQTSEKTNGNGRIVHEFSTNGAVFNPGNVNETPQFASLIWTVYRWTGDKAFLKKYYPSIKKGLAWLLKEQDADGNGLPEGFGLMEIHGLDSEMIDVAVYTQQALTDAAAMAREMGEGTLSEDYRQLAIRLGKKINSDFWVPESRSYADFIGTTRQARQLIEDAIVRADTLHKPWAVAELKATRTRIAQLPAAQKRGFVLHHNWVVNTPMEKGIADTAKALLALETGGRFVNSFGVFVTGIDRDETAGADASSFAADRKIFSYTGAVMTLPTGVQAIAENNYNRPDEALAYLHRMARSFSYALPGSIYEVSPDYGMVTQAWNIYSFAVPIVTQFFGIDPMASRRTVRIHPQMPSEWNNVRLDSVQVAENVLNVSHQRTGKDLLLTIEQSSAGWKVEVAFPRNKFRHWVLNGKEVTPQLKGNLAVLEASGNTMALRLTH